jgi:hypothetical protein
MLLFDKIHVLQINPGIDIRSEVRTSAEASLPDSQRADMDFLGEQGLLLPVDQQDLLYASDSDRINDTEPSMKAGEYRVSWTINLLAKPDYEKSLPLSERVMRLSLDTYLPPPDSFLRRLSVQINRSSHVDTVPICRSELPVLLNDAQLPSAGMQDILRVVLSSFPMPSDICSWQDILDFKAEMRDKQWDSRRFLQDLVTKKQTELQIRDDLDWSLNEYREAMTRQRIKIVTSALSACLVPAIDVLTNPTGHHLASIVGGAIAINKLRIELLEGEATGPGRTCAYVFDARKRFSTA